MVAPIIFGMPHSTINSISKINFIGSEGISYSLKKILKNVKTKPIFIQYYFKTPNQLSQIHYIQAVILVLR